MKYVMGICAATTALGFALQAGTVNAEESFLPAAPQMATQSQCFIGSSAFMLANFSKDSPDYYQLDLGYKLNSQEVILLHATTWKYDAPLGIPYGASFGSAAEKYPGYVRAHGIGMGYQRFVWEQVFASVHATAFQQRYLDQGGREIQKGTQLFLQAKVGYHMEFFGNQFYLEPAISFNHWPVNTNLPASFAARENKWKNYFLFEPSLNFGMNF
jgi:hypothetical protein